MNLPGFIRPIVVALFILLGGGRMWAHPIPDIPVRGVFETGGSCTIYVEMNPRCVDADPNTAPSLTKAIYEKLPAARKAELQKQVAELAQQSVEYYLEPGGRIEPEWTWEFTGEGHRPLMNDDDVVVIMGSWKTTITPAMTGWKIRAVPGKKLAIVFQNFVDGKMHPRTAVLFPGESSFTLELTGLSAAGSSGDTWQTFKQFVRLGFVHVLPDGFDHILFVVGLYLLSRSVRPLLWQITTFTLAHSVTLALATLGFIHAPRYIVEPIIALSIAAVALENIFHPRYTPWRLLIIFTFGLVHGLGFASALGQNLPKSAIVVGLLGFNVGVEGAQLAVIFLALVLTGWVRDATHYRRWIVLPGSALIAAIGLWWAAQRVFSTLHDRARQPTVEASQDVREALS